MQSVALGILGFVLAILAVVWVTAAVSTLGRIGSDSGPAAAAASIVTAGKAIDIGTAAAAGPDVALVPAVMMSNDPGESTPTIAAPPERDDGLPGSGGLTQVGADPNDGEAPGPPEHGATSLVNAENSSRDVAEATTEFGSQAPDIEVETITMRRVRPPGRFRAASLHAQPSTSATTVAMLQAGALIQLLGETVNGGGYTWARIRNADGLEGWLIAAAIGQE
jgi:hypothetical protein